METILRVAVVYLFLLITMRLLGKREFGQLSPFEFVNLLIISEIVQQAMIRDDYSLTTALVGVSVLLLLVYLTSLLSYRFKTVGTVVEGTPVVLVLNGKYVVRNMDRERIAPDEIQSEMHKSGLAGLDEVRLALLENDGKITFISEGGGQQQGRDDDIAK
jgi:uncharacterized membrane protein YcaP (DUF421 family)